MKTNSSLIRLFIVLLSITQFSCVTNALNGSHGSKEAITGFAISSNEQSQSLVIIGSKHSYILPLRVDIKRLLSWTTRPEIALAVSIYKLDTDQDVSIHYSLITQLKGLSQQDKDMLADIGFQQEVTLMSLAGWIDGHYYVPSDQIAITAFSKSHQAAVYPSKFMTSPSKSVFTPLAMIADGVLLLGGVAVIGLVCTGADIVGNECFPDGL